MPEHIEQMTAAPGESRDVGGSRFSVTGTIEEISASLIDVTPFGERPGSRHATGDLTVSVRTGAGTFTIPWTDDPPVIGDRIRIDVSNA
jgi:hypothetical protein